MANYPNQDVANTLRQQAETIRLLVDIGYTLHHATKAVVNGDLAPLAQDD